MSIWVRVFCQETVAGVTPEQLHAGIAQRLRLLTYLFCPEPDEVLDLLRIERYAGGDEFQVFFLYYRREGGGGALVQFGDRNVWKTSRAGPGPPEQ